MSTPRLLSCLLAALPLALVGCGTRDAQPRTSESERLPRLETGHPRRGSLPVYIDLSATVEAFEKADLCARVPGMVESLRLNPETGQPDPYRPELQIGRKVTAGEPLVKLAVPDLEADKVLKEKMLEQAKNVKRQAVEAGNVAARELEEAREQLNRYLAEYNFAKDKHERTVKLVERNVLQPEVAEETKSKLEAADSALRVARVQIQTKQAKVDAAAADLDVAESKIRVAQAEVERLTVSVGFATIRAKFDGTVTKRWVDAGAMIKDGSAPLLTIVRDDYVRVLMDIPERDIPLVNATEQNPNPNGKGDKVVVYIPALHDAVPSGEFVGYITRKSSALDPNTRTMRAEVDLENKGGHLRPGMTGTATVFLERRDNVLTVPSTALVRRGKFVDVYYVADVHGDPPRGIVKRAEVELGLDDGKRVEIRRGLKQDDHIIIKGNGVVHQDAEVYAVDTDGTGRQD
ncbi:MAG TPA: efflux RND transporter periplasmic adaptor subunit [Gemmataceae bacterium]|jgi:RND family efflux transporter MFP subunit|nr:efflux RND transporter periplasmic adaptor subunit [Gemmataceae bacterium]